MKYFVLFSFCCLSFLSVNAQYFTATFTSSGNTLTFKIKPEGGSIISDISLFQFYIRYPSSNTLSFTNIVENNSTFPSLNIIASIPFTAGGNTYIGFIHNSGTIASNTYADNAEYTVFSVDVVGNGMVDFELATNYSISGSNEYQYAVASGIGNALSDIPPGIDYFYPAQVNNAPDYYIPVSATLLPLELLSFEVKEYNKNVALDWKSQNELNLSHYSLQRSLTGADFKDVANIPAKGGNWEQGYEYTDKDVLPNLTYYYRLKIIDNDASFEYSPIRSARIAGKDDGFKLYPNPAGNTLYVELNSEEKENITLEIFDGFGRTAMTFEASVTAGNSKIPVDLSVLTSGWYVLRTIRGNENFAEGFYKN